MKLKLLKGTIKNMRDSISSPMFFTDKEVLNHSSTGDEWKIDFKSGVALDQNGKKINIKILKDHHKWFLKELKNAGIPSEKVEKSIANVVFGSKDEFRLRKCVCKISCEGKIYEES